MPEPISQDVQDLQKKVEQLEKKLEAYETSEREAWSRRYALMKSIGGFFLGPRLKKGVRKLMDGDVSKDNVSDIVVAVFIRFTRIGIFALLVAAIPSILLYQQNNLFRLQNNKIDKQNVRLGQQTNLLEADRRSALILESGNVMGLVSQELNDKGNIKDSLSQSLIARIIALSVSFKPYKYLDTDSTLTDRKISPERGHLLIGLVKSELDSLTYAKIWAGAIFSHAELSSINLIEADLSGTDLRFANLRKANLLKANLREADLIGADFYNTRLFEADFYKADLLGANFYKANFSGASLRFANLRSANLNGADFYKADLSGADFYKADFRGASLRFTNLRMTDLREADFYKADFSGADLRKAIGSKHQISAFIEGSADTTGMIWRDD